MPLKAIGRCFSAPLLSSLGLQPIRNVVCETQMDVYIGTRPFRECGGPVAQRLPVQFKEFSRTCGVCHYMLIFRQRDGCMHEFDFGPTGGDIHLGEMNPFAIEIPRLNAKVKNKSVTGEIREATVADLPEDFVYVGSTDLRLEDIRQFNSEQSTDYELHKNDCRHYANNLVKFATGIESASSYYVRARLNLMKHELPLWSLVMVRLFHVLTDVSHWPHVKAAGNATAAAFFALAGPSVVRRARFAAYFVVRRQLAAAEAPKQMVARPARRAAVAAIATVAATCEEVPVLKSIVSVAGTVNDGTKAFFNAAGAILTSVGYKVASSGVSPARAIAARCAVQPPPVYGFSLVRQFTKRSLPFLSLSSLFPPPSQNQRSKSWHPGRNGRSQSMPFIGRRPRRQQLLVPISI